MFLNTTQLQYFQLKPAQKFKLQIGNKCIDVIISEGKHAYNEKIYISYTAFVQFSFYKNEPLALINVSSNRLVLGPSLGLTVTPRSWSNIDQIESINKRAVLAHEKGILFSCFILDKIDWTRDEVDAYCYNNDETWELRTIPIPQVIYDRGSSLKSVNDSFLFSANWINIPRFLSKWETYCILSKKNTINNHIPNTALLTLKTFKLFIANYQSCFIKPEYGSNGRSVYKVEKKKTNYLVKSGGTKVHQKSFADVNKLYLYLKSTSHKNLLVQQPLELYKTNSSPMDMRVLVQKNAYNQWEVSAVNQRIASPNAVITNYSAGARDIFYPPYQDLTNMGLSWKELESFALTVTKSLDKYFDKLGELGLDICLDNKSKLWMLEANTRPSSKAYRNVSEKYWRRIFGNPLDYAIYLVKQSYALNF